MGKNKCVAGNCKNSREKCPGLSFHTIPKEITRRKKWLEKLLNPDLYTLSDKVLSQKHVCSVHFEDHDFNKPGRKGHLTEKAVPTLNIFPVAVASTDAAPVMDVDDPPALIQTADAVASTDAAPVMDVDDPPALIQTADAVLHVADIAVNDSLIVPEVEVVASSSVLEQQCSRSLIDHDYSMVGDAVPEVVPHLQNPFEHTYSSPKKSSAGRDFTSGSVAVLTKGLQCGRKAQRFKPGAPVRVRKEERTPLVVNLLARLSRKSLEARTYKSKYNKKCQEVKELKKNDTTEGALACLHGKIPSRLHKLLRAEVRNFSCKPQARKWFQHELAEFETMRQRGPKCFRGLPFTKPTRKTLTGLSKKLSLQPGINPIIMKILKTKVEEMPEEERMCTIMLDEMSIKKFLTHLEALDIVGGYVDLGSGDRRPEEAEDVLVVMIRSIYGTWKLPVAYFLTTKKLNAMDFMQLFQQSVSAVLEAGVEVRAMVSDALSKNILAGQMMGATIQCPVIFINGKKIVVIVDVPHLLKSLRNALQAYLLLMADGTLIDIKFIKAFILQDLQQNVRLAKKLTLKHVQPGNFDKMSVPLAAELLSKTTGSGVMAYTAMGLLPAEAMETGKFCELINNFFDSFNGTTFEENPAADNFRCALSTSSPHLQLWDHMLNEIQHWQFLGTNRVQVMKNWTQTMNAFKILWADLQVEGYKYLPVGHINQDCEENLFSSMRGNLGHTGNPSAAEMPACFGRSFIKNLTATSKGKNCRDDEAVNLVSMEELIEAIKIHQEAEPAELDEDDLSLELDYSLEQEGQEEDEPDQNNNSEALSQLEQTASAKLASSLVEKFVKNLKCEECQGLLQTEAQFPLHLDHTLTAGPSDVEKLLPSQVVADAVQVIARIVKLAQGSFYLKHVTKRLENYAFCQPQVESLHFCPLHADNKAKFVASLVKQTLQDRIKEMNRKRKEDKAEKQNAKYKKITHQ